MCFISMNARERRTAATRVLDCVSKFHKELEMLKSREFNSGKT